MAQATPSRDPADDGSMLGVLRSVLDKHLAGVDDMLPCRVISYNGNRNDPRVEVAPLVKLLLTDGTVLDRAPVASIPVFQLGAGGFILSFPIQAGDLGFIKANDRDISLFLQSYSSQAPNTLRKHSFSDAVYYPSPMRGYSVLGEDADHVVLQNSAGSVRVSVWADRVKLAAGALSVTVGPASVDVVGPANFTNAVTMAQTLAVTGAISAPGGATIGGIPFTTHKHTGVQTGAGNTGGPTP